MARHQSYFFLFIMVPLCSSFRFRLLRCLGSSIFDAFWRSPVRIPQLAELVAAHAPLPLYSVLTPGTVDGAASVFVFFEIDDIGVWLRLALEQECNGASWLCWLLTQAVIRRTAFAIKTGRVPGRNLEGLLQRQA